MAVNLRGVFLTLKHRNKAFAHTFLNEKKEIFMGGNGGRFLCGKFEVTDGFEYPACGNHVCRTCAKENGGLCPHCLGKLYRIS